jgi:cullin 3
MLVTLKPLEEVKIEQNVFTFNQSFKSKSKKVTLKEAKFVEKVADTSVIDKERKHAVQSVIVRLMKSRKELDYNKLVIEVEKLMFKFKPSTRVLWCLFIGCVDGEASD